MGHLIYIHLQNIYVCDYTVCKIMTQMAQSESVSKSKELYQQALKDAQAQNSGCSGTKSGGGQGANQLSRDWNNC